MRDVFFLSGGTWRVPDLAVASAPRVSTRARTTLSATVAVVVRDDESIVLVDAGFSEDVCAGRGVQGALGKRLLSMSTSRDDAMAPQLRALGIAPSRVRYVVATHLHFDHIGGARDFPNAELLCTPAELVAFSERSADYRGATLAGIHGLHTVELEPKRRWGFDQSRDLFDDGEIVLLGAPGHTAGGLAVAISFEKERRVYLHIGDAVYQRWEIEAARPSLISRTMAWDRREHARTRNILRQQLAATPDLVLVPSHDYGVFRQLPRAPAAEGDSAR